MNLEEKKNKANQLRKDKKYEQAAELYSAIINESSKNTSQWDEWGLAYCYYKMKKYAESLELCQKIHQEDASFETVNSLLAWNLYYLYVKPAEPSQEKKFFNAINDILSLLEQEDEYSPYVLTIFKGIDYLNKQVPVSYEKIINFLLMLQPDLLEDKKTKYKDKRGVSIEIPSQKEKYYTNLIKALRHTNRPEKAIEECDKALNTISEPSIKTKSWILRNKALAYADQKKYQEALNILVTLGDDWSVLLDIAEIYESEFNHKQALNYAIKSALIKTDPSLKVKCFLLIVKLLKALKHTELIPQHLNLIQLIYNRHKWKINDEMKLLMKEYDIKKIKNDTIESAYESLIQTWTKYQYKTQERYSGIICRIFPLNHYGFINSNDKNYFFNQREFKADKQYFKVGTRVYFNLADAFDTKKKIAVKNAINITLEQND